MLKSSVAVRFENYQDRSINSRNCSQVKKRCMVDSWSDGGGQYHLGQITVRTITLWFKINTNSSIQMKLNITGHWLCVVFICFAIGCPCCVADRRFPFPDMSHTDTYVSWASFRFVCQTISSVKQNIITICTRIVYSLSDI